MRLILYCTTKCNFSCPHCLRGRQKPKDLDIKLLKKVLDEANVLGFKTISITGGEPCLHSKFNEMIDLIVEKKFKFSMVTNGYYIKPYEEIIEKYKNNILFITFSIDGATAKTHNLQRCNNSFNKIISNIKKIRGKVYTRISTCLTKHNINELEDIVRLAEKLNLNEIAFLSAISTPNNKHIILSDNERINCIDRLKKIRQSRKININHVTSLYSSNPRKADFCNTLNLNGFTVNPYGELIFCCDTIYRGAVLGSLKKHSLKELMKKAKDVAKRLKKIREMHIKQNRFFEGFDSCEFCNYYLKDMIKK